MSAPVANSNLTTEPRVGPKSLAVPRATYRLQFHKGFTFEQANELAAYLQELGVGGVYASPILTARPGSVHGYDVINHDAINPEVGGEDQFEAFAMSLVKRDLALVLDVVPNHMCIAGSDNVWWNDVLENGPSSPYAKYFDIQWDPPKKDLENKVLLPFLGMQYGRMLESGEITLSFSDGRFLCHYYENTVPVAPRSWSLILDAVLGGVKARLGDDHPASIELESVLTALNHLPARTETDAEQVRTRYREKEVARCRLAALAESSSEVREAIAKTLGEFNGRKGEPRSFDKLEAVLDDQTYRLCFWRVAADEINYRRFFDISDLAAIRVEVPEVFDAVHKLALKLISLGWVTGLRIDHVDGLLDPVRYLTDLQQKCLSVLDTGGVSSRGILARLFGGRRPSDFYVVVEKILVGEERLRTDWATNGTTGYDYLNDLNGLYVDPHARRRMLELYGRFTGRTTPFPVVLATCKKLIMLVGLSSELHVLTTLLDRISEQHRWSRDFTMESLRFALRETIAYFPVYRTYIRAEDRETVSDDDRKVIMTAMREAKRHNPATDESIFDFVQSVLLLEHPDGLTGEQIAARRVFVLKFQQLTSPVMAKGMEDTAFYRHFPLLSLNEVGGDPERFGVLPKQFHAKNVERARHWPGGLLATTTHDTKRGEDARARINVLSEMPVKWYRTIGRWESWNDGAKIMIDGLAAPDHNEEYLFYQTLVGTWPAEPMDAAQHQAYVDRVDAYLLKAVKEAKLHTSWLSPHEDYEKAVSHFVRTTLERRDDNRFLSDLGDFINEALVPGLLNALSQTVLKLASPGVPDFYQGTELWDFNMVDPDNRRPVDYSVRRRLLAELAVEKDDTQRCEELMRRIRDGAVKLYIIKRALDLRRREEKLFLEGDYTGLSAEGELKNNVVAFSRSQSGKSVIAAGARFFVDLSLNDRNSVSEQVWGDTALVLKDARPGDRYRDIFTGHTHTVAMKDGKSVLPIARLFSFLPGVLLEKLS